MWHARISVVLAAGVGVLSARYMAVVRVEGGEQFKTPRAFKIKELQICSVITAICLLVTQCFNDHEAATPQGTLVIFPPTA